MRNLIQSKNKSLVFNDTSWVKKFKKRYRNEIVAYGLLAYPLIHWIWWFVYPLLKAFYLSFTDWDMFAKPEFIGLKNYIKALTDNEVFLRALSNTLLWTIVVTIGMLFFGFFVALLIERLKGKLKSFYRTAIYWPCLVGIVVNALMQKKIFSSVPNGLANKVLGLFGVGPIAWFDNPDIALWSLMIFPFFLGFGAKMLIFCAGLSQIPKVFYEAAVVDGASYKHQIWHITLPLIKPIFLLNLVMSVIEGFKVFGPMILVTNGGPMYRTSSVVSRIYIEGFQNFKMGYASAMAFILFVIILIVTILEFRLKGEQVSYE